MQNYYFSEHFERNKSMISSRDLWAIIDWFRDSEEGIQVITATSRNGDNKNGDTPKRRQQKRRQLWSKRRQCISHNGDNY